MSRIVLTHEESREYYDSQFAQLVSGQFFTIQYGLFYPPQYRLFYVKERRPDGMSVIVHELSNLENRNALIHGLPLVETMYRYNPENCLNVLNTTFGPGTSPDPSSCSQEPSVKKSKPVTEDDAEDEDVDILN